MEEYLALEKRLCSMHHGNPEQRHSTEIKLHNALMSTYLLSQSRSIDYLKLSVVWTCFSDVVFHMYIYIYVQFQKIVASGLV